MPVLAGVTAVTAIAGALVRDGSPAAAGTTLIVHVRDDGRADRMVLAGVDTGSGRAVLVVGPARLPGAAPAAGPAAPALARDLERVFGIGIDEVVAVDDDLLGRILEPAGSDPAGASLDAAALERWVGRLADPEVAAATGAVDGRLRHLIAAIGSGPVRVATLPPAPEGAAPGDAPALDVDAARSVLAGVFPSAVRAPADG